MIKDRGPKGDTYYNKRAENYDRRRNKQEWWHVEQKEMKSLLEGLPRNLKVVDIPFGTGRFVPYYDEYGYEVHGLDASGHMIEAARSSLGDLFAKCRCSIGDAAALPYSDGEFDLVVSTRFLRDIITYGHTKRVLAEFARITKTYAIVQLGQSTGDDREPDEDEVMGAKMNEASVDKLLKSVGFEPVERRLVKSDAEGEIFHILCKRI